MSKGFSEQPDQESQERAKSLAERLLSNADRIASEQGVDAGFPIDDVTLNLDSFSRLRRICLEAGAQIPCVAIGKEEAIPIDILGGREDGLSGGAGLMAPFFVDDLMARRYWERYIGMPYSYLLRDLEDWFPRTYFGNKITFVHPEEVIGTVKRLVSSFLAYRIWGIFGRRPTAGQRVAHLLINIETQNPGISVMFSPSYFATWMFFAGPTKPLSPPPTPSVCGPIRPGRYLFGGYGSLMPKRQVEPIIFDIPPTLHVPLTVV